MNASIGVRDYDWWLVTIILAICAFGVVEIWSATHASHLAGMHVKQMWWIAVGLAFMLLLSRLDYHSVLDKAPILSLIGIIALLAVLAMGHTRYGAKRWLPVMGEFLQVSEIAKLIIIVSLARFFSDVRTERLSITDLCKAAVLTAVPIGLILLQPGLGRAMVLISVVAGGGFPAGIKTKQAGGVCFAGCLVGGLWW